MNIYEKAFNELLKNSGRRDEYYTRLKNNNKHKSAKDFFRKYSPNCWLIDAFNWQGSPLDNISVRMNRHAAWARLDQIWGDKLSILAKRDDQRTI